MELIRSITIHRSMACLILDNGEKYWLSRKDLAEGGYQEGQETDPESLKRFVLLHQYRSALDRAVAMLARRPCSNGEIEQKLRQAHFSEQTIEMVRYKLEREHLLDDHSFTDQWVQYRVSHQYGPRRIYQELRQKGISEEIAENALNEVEETDQSEQAVALALKLLRRSKKDEEPNKVRQRVISAMIRRGYSWEQAKEAFLDAQRQDSDS